MNQLTRLLTRFLNMPFAITAINESSRPCQSSECLRRLRQKAMKIEAMKAVAARKPANPVSTSSDRGVLCISSS